MYLLRLIESGTSAVGQLHGKEQSRTAKKGLPAVVFSLILNCFDLVTPAISPASK